MRLHTGILLGAAALAAACGDNTPGAKAETAPFLAGHAVLPAGTFADGPPSGAYIGPGPINQQDVPFASQPVQGISAVIKNDDGTFWAMAGNGFGTMENSADFHLRVYKIQPSFKTAQGGTGTIEVLEYIELRDPDQHIPFAITNHFTTDRILTGADFDIGSMQRAPDDTLWFGDEFGPFLLHTDAQGVILEPPIPLPDFDNPGQEIRSPQNPFNEEAAAVRIMNAVRRHAELAGNARTPVFSPYHVMLDYEDANPSLHYARGDNEQPGLTPAASNVFSIESIHEAGYSIVTWTVNDKPRMLELMAQGVDGIISDRPDLLLEALAEFDADGDGTPGDYLTAEGLVDSSMFDAQGHRGARNLRPENTLPAMEAALDYLMTTLETDTGVTADGIAVLNHDPYIQIDKCRHLDGSPYTTPALIKDLTAADIQATFVCDQLIRGEPQANDPALSPVTLQFAADNGLADPYVMPTLEQLFDFVDVYIDYYQAGAGMDHPDAARRVANAMIVRFNIETKLNPRSGMDTHGNIYKDRTIDHETFADTIAGAIVTRGLEERADVQSFDFRTLLHVQNNYPAIRTVYLFGDFPIYDSPSSDDGTNLQDEDGNNTPWLAGLHWPYRSTVLTQPFRAAPSGGFKGMALGPLGKTLLPLLARPLDGGQELLIHQFALEPAENEPREFTGVRYRYPLQDSGHMIGDFVMIDGNQGLVIEHDGTQGDLNGFKVVYRITLQAPGQAVIKTKVADLLALADPDDIAISQPGDVGVGDKTLAFPFAGIGNVVVMGPRLIGILNDNNFPFGLGRRGDTGLPDDTEFIIIELNNLIPQATYPAR
jgi:glycerophosphoryl diester phosphodiesterase